MSRKLLYITANPSPVQASFGLRVGEHFLDNLRQNGANIDIEHLDLYTEDIPLIDQTVLSAWGKSREGKELTAEEQAVVGRMTELVDQFIEADIYVFVTPLWNLSYPPMLKAYIDNVVIAGKTFQYTKNGPIALLKDKKAVHIQARGGVYSSGPAQDLEFANAYLQGILGFIGVTDYEHLYVEGMAAQPDQADAILEEAKQKAEEAAKNLAGA